MDANVATETRRFTAGPVTASSLSELLLLAKLCVGRYGSRLCFEGLLDRVGAGLWTGLRSTVSLVAVQLQLTLPAVGVHDGLNVEHAAIV